MKTEYTQAEALKKMRSGKNIFLTGLPGTGKSYIIKQYIKEQQDDWKQVLICAPTGIAALNIGGVTMHQAFSIPIPAYGHYITEITNSKVKAALTADIIIIDEISMCRNDVFEYFGYVIDYINKAGRIPQIIVIGDMFQLPPVVPEAEVAKLKRYGFDSDAQTLQSVAEELGLEREDVRQIEYNAYREIVKILKKYNK
jgi:ATP-dependent exoDNAse (exonuclease V) alpha subunit